TGVQTNGLTLCRRIGDRVGYDQPCGETTYGRALLSPSAIYVDFVRELLASGVRPSYLVHLTGHGFRKLMRAEKELVYRVDEPGEPLPIFDFIQQHGPVERREMLATFNMGVGFVAYVRPDDADATVRAATSAGHRAWIAGEVVRDGEKAVELPTLGERFGADDLEVR
ncbi:MAG: AIR synthase-related protein, partial [Planctomycetota bacterium]